MKNRKPTLEQRINRLERLLKNEANASKKFESFESDLDEDGAREAASRLAKQFGQMVGVRLTRDDQHEIVDSPMFGWLRGHQVEDIEEDPDARYTFTYDVDGYPADSVMVRPTEGTICVWRSIMNGYSGEGAVDPKTGMCSWEDWLGDCSYPLSAWKNFNFDMIHGDDEDWDEEDDEEYESVKRPMKRPVKSESARKPTRRVRR